MANQLTVQTQDAIWDRFDEIRGAHRESHPGRGQDSHPSFAAASRGMECNR
jgi:hypothetical protein